MHLKTFTFAPPGGWRFLHPDGFVSTAVTFRSLCSKVAQYRANRNEPVVSEGYARLGDEIEAAICATLSPEDRQAHCVTGINPPTGVHWQEVVRFLTTMVSWAKAGFTLVDNEEAERRASICALCPMNVGLAGCAICKTTVAGLRDSLMKVSTSHDENLRACGVCGCDNKTQVHVPLDVLRRGGVKGLEYPSFCWKVQENV